MTKTCKKIVGVAIAAVMLISSGCAAEENLDNADESETTVTTVATTVVTNPYAEEIVAGKTTAEFVSEIKLGWNLGNTLDAHANGARATISSETMWGCPKADQELFDGVKAAGFNTVRIPVTWGNHTNEEYIIDEQWMKRVREVVDYAISIDLYVILNTHHEDTWLSPLPEMEEEITPKFVAIWEQISEEFKDYGEKLIFEDLNEPKTKESPNEWNGGTPEEHEVLNNLHQAFVDTVRASGGNNEHRFLMLSTYAASATPKAMNALVLPEDDRLIVSIHAYTPYGLTIGGQTTVLSEQGMKEIDNLMKSVDETFVSKGQPVIFGEICSSDYDNLPEREKHAEYYVRAATEIGVPCVWWDNGQVPQSAIFHRILGTEAIPEIIVALKKGLE